MQKLPVSLKNETLLAWRNGRRQELSVSFLEASLPGRFVTLARVPEFLRGRSILPFVTMYTRADFSPDSG